ncbi:MAG: hypothetical protein KAY32_00370 [Candidatus Eisenbacteria sp.]|nr:hypothetical protein [Candidatus Eisenbacteria bacterium]
MWVSYEQGDGPEEWRICLGIEVAVDLTGYSFAVEYPAATHSVLSVAADSAGVVENFLVSAGGLTPLLMQGSADEGCLWVANAIKSPTAETAPDGDGFLAEILISGPSLAGIAVTDIVLMDALGGLNDLAQPSGTRMAAHAAVNRLLLFANRPNPFFRTTTIVFHIPTATEVHLGAYDVAGRLVRTLVDGQRIVGEHRIEWDGRGADGVRLASGVDFYRLRADGFEETRRVLILH